MKKIIAITVSVLLLASLMMSGCSDFTFNPIGKWAMTDDILYSNGKEIQHTTADDMIYKDFLIIFEKSGTGYINVNGTKTNTFTYEYTDNDVSVKFDRTGSVTKYTVSEDKKKIIKTDKDSDDESFREDIIFTKK